MIVYNTATTANGCLADAEDGLDWLFRVPGEGPDMTPFTSDVAVCVMGSSTYEWLLRAYAAPDSPGTWSEFFGPWPAVVFTSREPPVPDGADVHFVRGPVQQALPDLRSRAGAATDAKKGAGTIWVMGGGDLAGQFLDAGALNRIVLTVAPAFLAEGKPLLPRSVPPERLRLVSARAVGQFAELTYDVVGTSREGD